MALTNRVIMPGADYQAICDAVREKTGETEALKSGEIAAKIKEIEAGNTEIEDAIVTGTLTEYRNDRVTSVRDYAFRGCDKLTMVNLPAATSISDQAFYGCPALTSVNLPAATSIGAYVFQACSTLAMVNLPAAKSIGASAFYVCYALTTVNLPAATSIGAFVFYRCSALATLILRNTENVCTLSNTNAFTSTPIASGKGYIYVPAALVDDYKAAENWSTYADQIRAIEDYPEITGTT